LVHACTDDAEVNAAVAAAAERRGIWCVRADDGAGSAAVTPASGVVDGLSVAVTASAGTAADPGRARDVRNNVLSGLRDGTLTAPPRRGHRGRVALVGGGPGDADLLTLRAARLLRQADVIVTDRLGPRHMLDELAPGVEVVDVGKVPRGPGARQEEINRILVERAQAGQFVVRLKGGDPFIFGRGGEELLACVDAGVECSLVPGISSSISVPELAGIPLTHRGVAQEFIVASGHLPPGHAGTTVDWAHLGRSNATLVLLMAVDNLPHITAALLDGGRPPDTPVACIQDGAMPDERVLVADLATVAERAKDARLAAPAVVVVGEVVRLREQVLPSLRF
ncbi:MAG: uroporphyrin-III C-methyltransferase / precorrin-2 dehydrogenase / sirohydrochlorin ferrochelatase, partial [Frankiaceae bacterium]|nr:uroporphyrin-III C-methyltransferase / precorrin-2 dehydrogenase / sirohydrochlorin ferrochelatase [Frankiaceae bacterium]